MPNTDYIDAVLTEIEPFEVELIDKEVISVNFTSVDAVFLPDEISIPLFIYNETPTNMTSVKFQTANEYRTGTLQVFLNGIKLNSTDMSEVSANTFSIAKAKLSTDTIEVSYIETAT